VSAPLLVTGAHGQLGRALVRLAEAEGRPVVPLSRAELDLFDPEALRWAVRRHGPSAVVNAAAYTAVDRAEIEPDLARAINAKAPGTLAAACAEAGIPMAHVSTDFVFDGTSERPYREGDPIRPLSVYGQTKAEGEAAVREHLAEHLIVRTSWVFAPGHANFVTTIARLARERATLQVVADQWGSPTPADVLARALLLALDRAPASGGWGTYHYGGEPASSRFGLAEAVVEALRRRGMSVCERLEPVSSSAFPAPAVRPARAVLDSSRLRERLGIDPPDWRPAVDALVAAL
jgi:dTDP-4-dehydrorhamnose reductase